MSVVFSPRARFELGEAVEFGAATKPERSSQLLEDVQIAARIIEILKDDFLSGDLPPPVPAHYRSVPLASHPYLVIFDVRSTPRRIIRVLRTPLNLVSMPVV